LNCQTKGTAKKRMRPKVASSKKESKLKLCLKKIISGIWLGLLRFIGEPCMKMKKFLNMSKQISKILILKKNKTYSTKKPTPRKSK